MIIENPCRITKNLDRIRISETLIHSNNKKITNYYYPKDIKSLFLFKHSSISIDVLSLLKDKEVCVLNGNKIEYFFVPNDYLPKRFYYDALISKLSKKVKRKIALTFCKGVCSERIKMLVRLNESRKNHNIQKIIKSMQILNKRLSEQKSIEQLKSIEGGIARYFYSAISEIKNDFEGRDKNSKDLMNVLFNYTHSILRAKVYRCLLLNNLNPHYGFLHFQKDKNKPFLSWDFSEFWIPYCDKLCLYMFERGVIRENEFKEGKLTKGARIKIIELIENRILKKDINLKIDEFKDFLENKKRFSWIVR